MSRTTVKIDPGVFNDVYYPHLDNYTRTQIFYGGASSGKSFFIVGQRVVFRMLKGDHNFLICRQTATSLKNSVFTEVLKCISDWNLDEQFEVNKSEMTITCIANKSQAKFAGLDDVERLKSTTFLKGTLTDVIVEEATETKQSSIKQLIKRQRGMSTIKKTLTLLFNPVLQDHWIYKEYFIPINWQDDQAFYADDDLFIMKTIYKDNSFLTEEDCKDLEAEQDEYYFNVYTLGNWGVLGAVIFTNWEVRDLDGMDDQWTNPRYGQDFGFSNDPAATVFSHYDKKKQTIYIYDEHVQLELSDEDLGKILKERIGKERITCDSSEPKSIKKLRELKVNAVPAKKGNDSVGFGLKWLKTQNIVVGANCPYTQAEFRAYKWKENKFGEAMPQPEDKNNHIMDALRYAYERDMVRVEVNPKASTENYSGHSRKGEPASQTDHVGY